MENNFDNAYKDFLLKEYSNIAQAHFKSIESISNFFRYYILIMTIPISALGLAYQITANEAKAGNVFQSDLLIQCLFLGISFVGVGIFCYVVNLRLDVVLYARVVNSIRKYFYNSIDMDIKLKIHYSVLPQSPSLPLYLEKSYFFPVVFAFATVNSFYFFIGIQIFNIDSNSSFDIISYEFLFVLIFCIFHLIIYFIYANSAENRLLRNRIIGVDIDGVLNKQHVHFCNFLKKSSCAKEISSDDITIIPVHDDQALEISKNTEREIFNNPNYWEELPVEDNASDTIRSLRNALRFKIFIFTYRPWPDHKVKKEQVNLVKKFLKKVDGLNLLVLKTLLFLQMNCLVTKLKEEPLKIITRKWLKKENIVYDKLIIEKGNDYSSSPSLKFKNRFYYSKKKKIRFFIEDEPEKAIKLSFICDVVFLMARPYNKENLTSVKTNLRNHFPSNIIRVSDWDEIFRYIKLFS